jgi:hypothetical protein
MAALISAAGSLGGYAGGRAGGLMTGSKVGAGVGGTLGSVASRYAVNLTSRPELGQPPPPVQPAIAPVSSSTSTQDFLNRFRYQMSPTNYRRMYGQLA